ncbi:MAG: hypothetical protein R3264_11925, partial [Anaerolineae bacterium]|nr:hypothetical protein [Anaerolineae bacterium]
IIGGSGSGGGVFWAGQFFPAQGDQYQAHMVLACGASVANSTDRKLIRALGSNPDIVARSSFYHIYGTEDSQVSQQTVEGNMAMYREEGFRVAGEKLVGAGHCNEWTDQGFPGMKEQLVEQWGILTTELGIN